ncbi:MAG: ATP synthase F0 subunit C [Anaerolineaceae bacterium]|jgi:F-type H+-transporting ATPase subunit c|nr:ATP synthase F0 subunit C [Anaerolineaceae bacterium]MDI9531232.1 ATP synthase F0 subunit C [Chloroflexota bacterium]HNZ16087.1 ATP synthase F0 subunit C [Anaerolineaceae bacterium]HOF27810.1 ATP synthase F0 subunit C [Anaerolineaceae bacterium]
MENLTPEVLIIIVTTIVCGLAIVIGTMIPTWVEGKAAEKAIEGMARQPDASPQLRTAMLISLALLETASIYVLLVVLVLLFANPLIAHFYGG